MIADEEIYWSAEKDYQPVVTLTKRQVKFVVAGELLLLFITFAFGAGWAAAAFGVNFF